MAAAAVLKITKIAISLPRKITFVLNSSLNLIHSTIGYIAHFYIPMQVVEPPRMITIIVWITSVVSVLFMKAK